MPSLERLKENWCRCNSTVLEIGSDLLLLCPLPVSHYGRLTSKLRQTGYDSHDGCPGVLAHFIFAAYLALLVVVAARRVVRGKAATEDTVVCIADGVAEIRQGADPGTLVGLFLIAASFLWTTVGVAVGGGALNMLLELPGGVLSTIGIFYLALIAFAAFIILWSIWLGFGSWGVRIDGPARCVTTWWGLMRPWRRRVRPLSDFDAVAVRLGPRRGFRARSYTVGLEGGEAHSSRSRLMAEPRTALELAKQVAAVQGSR